uniref:Uncharacterized protein n=1 Tax=Caenorhabditis japonica TaxID=281687 RepID=A0A8R1IB40_CAEJA
METRDVSPSKAPPVRDRQGDRNTRNLQSHPRDRIRACVKIREDNETWN